MSCNTNQECGENQACVDGACVPIPDAPDVPPIRRKTFTTAWSEYAGDFKAEQQKVKDYGEMLKDDLDDAAEERRKALKKQKDAGSKFGIFGAILGAILAVPTGGLSLALGATIGATAGYAAGSGMSDLQSRAEESGLSTAELKALDRSSLKYLAGTHGDIYDEAVKVQGKLDEYDDEEWQNHVYGAIQAGWSVYKLASLGEGIWEGGKKVGEWIAGEGTGKEVAETLAKETVDYSITTVLDNITYDTPGSSSAQGWGEDN